MGEEKKKRGKYLRILGELDKKVRLCADSHGFILQEKKITEKKKEVLWVSKYYYSTIQYAIQGYAKYLAKKGIKKQHTKPLLDLLDLVNELNCKITEVGKKLSKEWKDLQTDPIEKLVAEGKDEC